MDVMIDIETFGNKPDAVIATLGAVVFDPMKVQSEEEITQNHRFLIGFDIDQQPGRTFSGDTIRWWMTQKQEPRFEAIAGGKLLGQGLAEYKIWYKAMNIDNAWCWGATFDHVILQHAFNQHKLENPTKYWKQLCARTMVKVAGIFCPPSDGVKHAALDDAIRQASWLQLALSIVRKGTPLEDPKQA